MGRIDNLVAMAEVAANQGNMAIPSHLGRYDLGLTAIVIHNVIAFLRCAYPLAVVQCEYPRRCRLLNHPAVTSLAALDGHSVNGDRGMGFSAGLIFINNRQGLFIETGKLLLRGGDVSRVRRNSGETLWIYNRGSCIHLYDPDPWGLGYCPLVTSARAICLVHLGR